jgi:hypothetical protein
MVVNTCLILNTNLLVAEGMADYVEVTEMLLLANIRLLINKCI